MSVSHIANTTHAQPFSIKSYKDRDRYVMAISPMALGAADKLVLIRLAFHINFKSGRCDPAAATLARELGTHERAVRRTIARLEQSGLIVVDRSRGRHSNQFTLLTPNPGQNARVEPGQNRSKTRSPTRINVVANPGADAHQNCLEPIPWVSKETPRDRGRESPCANAQVISEARAGAFEGAAEPQKEEKQEAIEQEIITPAQSFAELRALWLRPWADNDDREAMRSYVMALRDTDPDVILAAARACVEAADAPRFLQKLSKWLADRGWEKPPPLRARRKRMGTAEINGLTLEPRGKTNISNIAVRYGAQKAAQEAGQ
jgi:hypothetical protein